MAIVAEGEREPRFISRTRRAEHEEPSRRTEQPDWKPDQAMNRDTAELSAFEWATTAMGSSPGLTSSPTRQLVALTTFSDLVGRKR